MFKQFLAYYKPHRRLFVIDFSIEIFVALLDLAFYGKYDELVKNGGIFARLHNNQFQEV